jgi:hypothetical protein
VIAAVADHAHAHVEAKRAAVADVGAIEALAVRILLTLGIRGVRFHAEVVGERMLQVDADLVRRALALFEAAVEIHRRSRLAVVDHRAVIVELHAAQVVDAEPQAETVRAGFDRSGARKLSSIVSSVSSDGRHWNAMRPSMRSSVTCDCSAPNCCCHQPTMVLSSASRSPVLQVVVSWQGANMPPSQPETNTRFASVSRFV